MKKLHASDELCLDVARKVFRNIELSEPIVVFDVGANEGLFTKKMHEYWSDLDLEIHCFEPNVEVHLALAQNLAHLSSVQINQFGFSNYDGTLPLYYPAKKTELGSLINRTVFEDGPQKWGGTIKKQVKVLTINGYFRSNYLAKVDFLKIDTEGTELNVLHGADSVLASGNITCGQFEYGGTFLDAQLSIVDVVKFLEKFNYVVYDVTSNTVVDIHSVDDFRMRNYFFCKQALVDFIV